MKDAKIAIIGLGYVGLPLAVEFGKITDTVGFDINRERIEELNNGRDHTLEVDADGLRRAERLTYTSDATRLRSCNYYIITVPTPIDKHNNPDLRPLLGASEIVGKVLSRGDIVIYESTVYPGCTEEDCVPILEKHSGLRFNADFFCGYSPERITPGDKEHTISKIRKVVSGSTLETLRRVDELYSAIIAAGTYRAPSIRVAEAAKVIENSQRDINIAFVNELAIIFQRMGIDTHEVLAAARSNWNFLPFRPGLVGGHCIGVDPYYLTFKAQALGYHPEVILAGRRINDGMGAYVAQQVIKLMIRRGHKVGNASVLVLGVTFKENCPDIRNSRAVDIVRELGEYGCLIDIHDPWADAAEVKREYGLELKKEISGPYDAVILAVAHRQFADLNLDRFINGDTVIYDVKGLLDKNSVTGRL